MAVDPGEDGLSLKDQGFGQQAHPGLFGQEDGRYLIEQRVEQRARHRQYERQQVAGETIGRGLGRGEDRADRVEQGDDGPRRGEDRFGVELEQGRAAGEDDAGGTVPGPGDG